MKKPNALDDLNSYVRRRANQLKITLEKLAEKTGITRQGLDKLLKLNGEKSSLSTLIKLANAIEVHPFVLLRLIFATKEFTEEGALHLHDATGFISDVTIPDGLTVFSNQVFVKTWEIRDVRLLNFN